jgi:hypothetical protein
MPTPTERARRAPAAATAITAAASLAPGVRTDAQTAPVPNVLAGRYVPASGTVYRVDTPDAPAPGAPKQCLGATHVACSWSVQGPEGDPGAPSRAP